MDSPHTQILRNQCSLCHAPLETTQNELCLACHEATAQEIELGQGAHGHIDNVDQCANCHPDHRGADYDPLRGSLSIFRTCKDKF